MLLWMGMPSAFPRTALHALIDMLIGRETQIWQRVMGGDAAIGLYQETGRNGRASMA